jgi:hypothetical protein
MPCCLCLISLITLSSSGLGISHFRVMIEGSKLLVLKMIIYIALW